MATAPWTRKSSQPHARADSSGARAAAARPLAIPQIRWLQPRRWLQKTRAEVSTNLRERQRSGLRGISRSRPLLISEARRRDDLLDIRDRRCRNRIGRLVSFKGNITGARPETLPFPSDNSACSRAGTSAELGGLKKRTLDRENDGIVHPFKAQRRVSIGS
jgi:hypothetical protein